MIPATLLQFARANDAAAATTKKLLKQAALAVYFRDLDETDLRLAARYAGGRAFASTDERVLNVGGALVGEVTHSILAIDPREYHDLVVRSGEIGEALSKVWSSRAGRGQATSSRDNHGTQNPTPLTLRDLAAAFDALASTGAWGSKREIVHDLFTRCADGREAAYLAKIIFGDLRTGVQEGVLQAAVAEAFGKPLKQVQRCQLLVGDLGDVAVLAKNDALESATFRLFYPVQFTLATPQETAVMAAGTMAGRAFYAEDKLDGIRAQVHKSGGTGADARVAVYTRTMDRADGSFPDVVGAVAQVPGEFLLDGEIVPWRNGQVLPFAHIQKRLGRKVLTPKVLKENPCAYVAFDVLYHNGDLLMDRPLNERRERLATIAGLWSAKADPTGATGGVDEGSALADQSAPCVAPSGVCALTPGGLLLTTITEIRTADEISAAFDAARARRNEGIVLKDPDSPYSPGRRGKVWLKIKTHLPTFDCVVTAAEYGHGKRRDWLSDYTFAVWDRDPALPGAALVNVGKAYSGCTEEEIIQLTDLFHRLSRGRHGRVHAVEPKVVLEIACDQIQRSARHASGYALRFPRIKRIRWDKRPEDADRLDRVAEIYESSPNFARPTEAPDSEPAEPTLFDGLV